MELLDKWEIATKQLSDKEKEILDIANKHHIDLTYLANLHYQLCENLSNNSEVNYGLI